MKTLYPPLKSYETGRLKVSKIHTIYYEESGNPNGLPILFLHGGPGSSSKPKHRQRFNPQKYRIILFDQRGCGKSQPQGELKENTTQHLITDIEKLREHLSIKKWHIYGFSWGATLALAYAEKYPQQVSALIVGGIFLFTKWEISWLHDKRANIFYPDIWPIYTNGVPKNKQTNLLDVFYKRIFSNNKKIRDKAIKDFNYWDSFRMDLVPEAKYQKSKLNPADIAGTKIYFHYAKNKGFFKEDELIKNAYKLKNIPGVILHGRYDMICPPINAWRLHQAWPRANFHIIEASGHHSTEKNKISQIIKYTDKFSKK